MGDLWRRARRLLEQPPALHTIARSVEEFPKSLSPADHATLHHAQRGLCALCGADNERLVAARTSTGSIFALVCGSCGSLTKYFHFGSPA